MYNLRVPSMDDSSGPNTTQRITLCVANDIARVESKKENGDVNFRHES